MFERISDKKCELCDYSLVNMFPGSDRHVFKCPNTNEKWHIQLRLLIKAKMQTPSREIANLIQGEINEILEWEKPTREDVCFDNKYT